MTSSEIANGLKNHGISYSDSAVRAAWRKGAPRELRAFISWLALSTESDTGASSAAAETIGLSRRTKKVAGGKLSLKSSFEGAALLAELFGEAGARYWFAAAPVVWLTLLKASEWQEGQPTSRDVYDSEDFLPACIDAVNALGRVAFAGVKVGKQLREKGYEADPSPWLALADTNEGRVKLYELACQSYEQFAALPDGGDIDETESSVGSVHEKAPQKQ